MLTSPSPRLVLCVLGDRLYNTGIQNQMFSYYQDEDELSFQLVDNKTRARGASAGGFRPMVRIVRLRTFSRALLQS